MTLHTLPAHSRLWLLALDAPPDRETEARLRLGLERILAQWRHKGQAYRAAGVLLEPQLIAVAEPDCSPPEPSGCAIDGMLRRVRRLAETGPGPGGPRRQRPGAAGGPAGGGAQGRPAGPPGRRHPGRRHPGPGPLPVQPPGPVGRPAGGAPGRTWVGRKYQVSVA